MLFFLSLFIFSQSEIPIEFQELAARAKKNSLTKIPKNLREDTKFPGFYEGDNYQFRLLKVLTSSNTNDIKGFASDDNYFAIVKRKQFNLSDEFVFVDPDTQMLHQLNKQIASEDNVIIYESRQITIFSLMTDFIMRASTNENVNLRSSTKANVNFNPSIGIPIGWNETVNRPEMKSLLDDDFQVGAGLYGNLSVDIKFSFKGITDVRLKSTITLKINVGAEILIPDNYEKNIKDEVFKLFSDIKLPIVGTDFKFLMIHISLGAFMCFDTLIKNIQISVPIGFHYFKGYQMTATKFFEITKYSTTDSKWDIFYTSLPEIDSINDVVESLDSARFSLVIECKPHISFEFQLGRLSETSLKAGIKIPFNFMFSVDKNACMFPHIKADISIPIKGFLHFTGLKIIRINIIDQYEKEIPIFNIQLPRFCLGGSQLASDHFQCDSGSQNDATNCRDTTDTSTDIPVRIITLDASDHHNSFKITFKENEEFAILKINVPNKFIRTNLGIISQSSDLEFLIKGRTIYNSAFSYMRVTQSPIFIPVRKNPDATEMSFNLILIYFVFEMPMFPSITILNRERPATMWIEPDIYYRLLLVPATNDDFTFQTIHKCIYKYYLIKLNDNEYLYMLRIANPSQQNRAMHFSFVLSYISIADNEPSTTINLNYQLPLYTQFDYTKMTVYCNHGQQILAKIGGKTFIEPLKNGNAEFKFNGLIGYVTFIPICNNKSETYCQIYYEAPKENGYHLIQYPNRNGITIMELDSITVTLDSTSNTDLTGSGFYQEIIPVIKGQGFTYYKTYPGELITVQEYPLNTSIEQLKMKKDDLDNYNGVAKARRFCLFDESNPDSIIPFSRKYFSENFETLADALGFDSGGDYNTIENDENGCIYFPAEYINETSEIKDPKAQFCDLPVREVTTIVTNPEDDIDMIGILIVAGIAVVVIVIISVVSVCTYKCIKKKKKQKEQEQTPQQEMEL